MNRSHRIYPGVRSRVSSLMGLALLCAGLVGGGATVQAAPTAAIAAPLPAATCTLAGSTRTCDLWAKTGSLNLPDGKSVPILGYSDSSAGAAQLPGPALVVNQGETVKVILHNSLTDATSLSFPGQSMAPDTAGVVTGGSKVYTFTASNPGTSIYEAGLTANGHRQVAMGLYGAMVVRPSGNPKWGYDAATAFDDEALLVLSEIDPALNANPASFNLLDFAPKYWLLNGKAFPDADQIGTAAGHRAILRFVNAGLKAHSVGLLGIRQAVIANDGQPMQFSRDVVAETVAAGQSMDSLVTIAPATPAGTQFALYDAAIHVDNSGARNADGTIAFGGMLTFLTIPAGTPGADTVGPVVSGVAVTPNPTTGASGVTLSAKVSDVTTGNSNVTAAEYFVDSVGANGGGTAFTGSFGTPSLTVSATISAATLAALSTGNHTFYIHGQDANGNWGAVASSVLTLVKSGPAISGMSLTPSVTNGSADVAIQATGDNSAAGAVNVTAAEFFIDTTGANGSGSAMALNQTAPIVSLTATIPSATVKALAEGAHTISIHAQDALGTWGAFGTIKLNVDKSAPTTSGVVVAPTPNNGSQSADPNLASVKVTATITDPVAGGINSAIAAAEGFIDTVGATGTGIVFTATDGVFNSATEPVVGLIPLSGLKALAAGTHTIYVRGKDAAGNWGPTVTGTLVIDRTAPGITNTRATVARSTNQVILTATATDPANGNAPASTIVAAEWFEGADPGQGLGKAMNAADGAFNSARENLTVAIDASKWTRGNHTLSLRAKDAAGNWSTVVTTTVRW